MNIDTFKKHLRWAEGVRAYPYEDSEGHLTIGVGRLLSNGLSEDEIEHLLHNDAMDAIRAASTLPYWDELSDTRKLVVADLCFNLGLTGWKGFVKANDALERGDPDTAADEMEDSRWFHQVGRRARKLVHAMRTGEWNCWNN